MSADRIQQGARSVDPGQRPRPRLRKTAPAWCLEVLGQYWANISDQLRRHVALPGRLLKFAGASSDRFEQAWESSIPFLGTPISLQWSQFRLRWANTAPIPPPRGRANWVRSGHRWRRREPPCRPAGRGRRGGASGAARPRGEESANWVVIPGTDQDVHRRDQRTAGRATPTAGSSNAADLSAAG
jgi:hypothetical protein